VTAGATPGRERRRPVAILSTGIVHPQLWESVAERIREGILSGALPVGTKLSEVELAERYGVSRIPIREALRHLTRTGMVVLVPRKGAYVPTPEDSDYEELYLARDAIETAAGRLAVARMEDADVGPLRRLAQDTERAYSAGELEAAWSLDLQLHRRIVELAGNRHLLDTFDRLADLTLVLHHHKRRIGESLGAPPVGLHADLAEALAARDEEAVVTAIERHFGYAADQPLASASSR
jgi:DNA-binding GntR family transcriptional regulator